MRDNFISSPTILVKFVSIRQRNFHQHAFHVFPSKFRESKKLQNFIIVKLRYHVPHFLSTFFIKTCVYSEPSAESNLSEKKTQTFEIIIIRNLSRKILKKNTHEPFLESNQNQQRDFAKFRNTRTDSGYNLPTRSAAFSLVFRYTKHRAL